MFYYLIIIVMAKENDQAILEAKANIDIAKMMNALDNIKTSTNWLQTNTLETMEKWFKEAMKFIQAMQELKQIKDCVFNEARIAKDIVDWIKAKSTYIEEIQKLKIVNETTKQQNVEFIAENQRIKRLLVTFIEKFDIWQEDLDIDFIKRELNVSVKPLREIQENAWNKFLWRLKDTCTMEQDPFR